jgi:hypothetical protein
MNITIRLPLPEGLIHHWQVGLIEALQRQGHEVALQSNGPIACETHMQLLTRFDRAVFRSGMHHPFNLRSIDQYGHVLAHSGSPRPDLIVDLVGDAPPSSTPVLSLMSNGMTGETALSRTALACMTSAHQLPQLAIMYKPAESENVVTLLTAYPALEEPHHFTASLFRLCQRACDLICQAIPRITDQQTSCLQGPAIQAQVQANLQTLPSPLLSSRTLIAYMGASLWGGAQRRMMRPFGTSEHWRIAWRQSDSMPLKQALAERPEHLCVLPDNGQHFYADPFVVWREGKAHVFCEDLPYATGRGVIAHFTIDAAGHASQPEIVLQRPYHLSYPFIFEHEGTTYMIPETAQNKTIELYRCDHFPDQWSFVRVLIDQIEAADATVLRHEGRWWIFASLAGEGRSSWDALGLFYADQLEGPWQAHCGNPVVIDASQARPAGAIFQQEGALIRPAQDCRGGYGRGVHLCRIDRLDPKAYQQTLIDALHPSALWGYSGLHTLNRAGPWEVFDLKGWRRQFSIF